MTLGGPGQTISKILVPGRSSYITQAQRPTVCAGTKLHDEQMPFFGFTMATFNVLLADQFGHRSAVQDADESLQSRKHAVTRQALW